MKRNISHVGMRCSKFDKEATRLVAHGFGGSIGSCNRAHCGLCFESAREVVGYSAIKAIRYMQAVGDDTISSVFVTIVGPTNSPWELGEYILQFKVDVTTYPAVPPLVSFDPPIYHPYVTLDGKVTHFNDGVDWYDKRALLSSLFFALFRSFFALFSLFALFAFFSSYMFFTRVTHHASRITRHASRVTRHASRVTRHASPTSSASSASSASRAPARHASRVLRSPATSLSVLILDIYNQIFRCPQIDPLFAESKWTDHLCVANPEASDLLKTFRIKFKLQAAKQNMEAGGADTALHLRRVRELERNLKHISPLVNIVLMYTHQWYH
jgi:hypothetical protein